MIDKTLPLPIQHQDTHGYDPKKFAKWRKREYESKLRDEAWAYDRSIQFCTTIFTTDNKKNTTTTSKKGKGDCLHALLNAGITCHDHVMRREITVVLGRILAAIGQEDESKIK